MPCRLPYSALRDGRTDTQRVIMRMLPVYSAKEMKSAGETLPRVGCCQRISASTPAVSPFAKLNLGWENTTILVRRLSKALLTRVRDDSLG